MLNERGTPEPSSPSVDPAWAWAPYVPDDARPWNLAMAAHLYRRAAFGEDWARLQTALDDGPRLAIDKLLAPAADVAEFNRDSDQYEEAASRADATNELAAWWLRRMILSPHPLLEKMTLFWHGYFGLSQDWVHDAGLMWQHVSRLRRGALGSFASMLGDISQDPAVLIGLGADAHRRTRPNDKLVRTLFDHYGLGPGNYAEEDIREAARAMSGWFVLRNQLRYIEREHDPGDKTVLGEKGPWKRDDIVRIVLSQPATPRRVVRAFYRWLISEVDEPSDTLLAPLDESFGQDYNVAKLVATMLRANLFFSRHAVRRRIQSPVELAVGIVRGLEGMVPTLQLGNDLAALGQKLYHPPTVKGWPGGRAWINLATSIGRRNLATALFSGKSTYGNKLDPWKVAKKHGRQTHEAAARLFIDLFLQDDVPSDLVPMSRQAAGQTDESADRSDRWLRRFVHDVVASPEFQLA